MPVVISYNGILFLIPDSFGKDLLLAVIWSPSSTAPYTLNAGSLCACGLLGPFGFRVSGLGFRVTVESP